MSSVNKIILLGRLGNKPELRTAGSAQVAGFSLATSEKYKDKSGNLQEETTWFNCEAWNRAGEVIAQYCDKGSQLYVEGTIKIDEYEKDGQPQRRMKVRVLNFTLLGGKADASTQPANPAMQKQNGYEPKGVPANYQPESKMIDDLGNDELPF